MDIFWKAVFFLTPFNSFHISSILLKNTLKNHLSELKGTEELSLIKQALFLALIGEDLCAGNQKLQEEFYMIMSSVIVTEFF